MGRILQFPATATAKFGFQPVKSTYTLREIIELFGLNARQILRWTRDGLIPAQVLESGESVFDFRSLTRFRLVRDLRDQGMTDRQIEVELRGQLNLFARSAGELLSLPSQKSPFEQALLFHELGDPRAIALYRRAIRAQDCVADAFCNLGILEYDRGKKDVAGECFHASLRHDPRHFESHYNLGNLHLDSDDYEQARAHYQRAIELEPGFPNAYFNLGLVQALEGAWPDARRQLSLYRSLAAADDGKEVEALLTALNQVIERATPRKPVIMLRRKAES